MKFTAQFSIPRIDVSAYRKALDRHMSETDCPGPHGLAGSGLGGDSGVERGVPGDLRETGQCDRPLLPSGDR